MTKVISPMLLTETVTKHYTPLWFKRDFTKMSEEFKRVRSSHNKKYNRCFCCDWPFQIGKTKEEGESVHLVNFGSRGNELLCTDCLDEVFGEKSKLEHWKKENES